MAVKHTTLPLDSKTAVKQDMLGIMAILDDPELMRLALEQRDSPASAIAKLIWDTRELMNDLGMVAPIVQLGTSFGEIPVIHYSSEAGVGIYLFPPSFEEGSVRGTQILPAFISDGFSKLLNQSRDNVFVYIVENFTVSEQLEVLQVILQWYTANFASPNGNGTSRINKCVKDFCGSIERIISSETAHEQYQRA